jgi:uncharacterized protein (TIGR03437 family)
MQANGSGVAAALTTQDGSFYQPVGNPDGSARAISVGSLDHPTWLALFGTGVRGRTALSEVTVRINGINCAVAYAGTQSGYDGLDQLNVQLPQSLRNSGDVAVEIIVNGLAANRTRLLFGG